MPTNSTECRNFTEHRQCCCRNAFTTLDHLVNCRFHDYQHHCRNEKQWYDRRGESAGTTGQVTRATNMKKMVIGAVIAAAVAVTATASFADKLDDVKAKGFVACGVTEGLSGFSLPDANNEWSGIDVDYCRAVASAVFGDPKAVRVIPTTSTNRWQMLTSGEVDILARTSTWTMQRDAELGVDFIGTLVYDGQGFLVKKSAGIKSALELGGAALCIEQGTTTELNAADYFATNNLEYTPVTFVGQAEVLKALEDGRCDAMTSDSTQLAANRSAFVDPSAYDILPEIISKEPLAPLVAQGDARWADIAKWTLFALINSEELGVSSANVDEMLASDNPEIRRLLGVEGDFGAYVGLSKDWAYNIVKGVGNYGELWERNVGESTPIGLPRGLNALWKDGGIMYAPPIR
jgi:general L-amino acid transport system substrate-binding protein